MGNVYRAGAVGALMDEFERAGRELSQVIGSLTDTEFEAVRDAQAPEASFRSIQTVFHHVVSAGYAHANHLRVALSVPGGRVKLPLVVGAECGEQMSALVSYWAVTLDGCWEMTDEEIEAVVIRSSWGVTYDLEQMLEHTIVHVLRHRRQIERFLAPVVGEERPPTR